MRTHLKNDENVLFEVRQHYISLLPASLVVLGALLVPLYLKRWDWCLWSVPCSFGYFLYCWLAREVNIWAVTNRRVIDEWGLLSNNSKESPLEKINNVNYSQSILGRILGFGNVIIQTAATYGDSIVKNVEHPKELQETIVQARDQFTEAKMSNVIREQFEQIHGAGKPEDTIECPRCAETIKRKAKICHFCGLELSSTEVAAPTATEPRPESNQVIEEQKGRGVSSQAAAPPINWKQEIRKGFKEE